MSQPRVDAPEQYWYRREPLAASAHDVADRTAQAPLPSTYEVRIDIPVVPDTNVGRSDPADSGSTLSLVGEGDDPVGIDADDSLR